MFLTKQFRKQAVISYHFHHYIYIHINGIISQLVLMPCAPQHITSFCIRLSELYVNSIHNNLRSTAEGYMAKEKCNSILYIFAYRTLFLLYIYIYTFICANILCCLALPEIFAEVVGFKRTITIARSLFPMAWYSMEGRGARA